MDPQPRVATHGGFEKLGLSMLGCLITPTVRIIFLGYISRGSRAHAIGAFAEGPFPLTKTPQTPHPPPPMLGSSRKLDMPSSPCRPCPSVAWQRRTQEPRRFCAAGQLLSISFPPTRCHFPYVVCAARPRRLETPKRADWNPDVQVTWRLVCQLTPTLNPKP